MPCVIKIPEFNTVYALAEEPGESPDWEVIPGGWVEIPDSIFDWPEGVDDPPPLMLGVCRGDPRHYRLFRLAGDAERAGFEPAGMVYGGWYSPPMWGRFVAGLPALRAFYAIPDDDPPGAMEEAMRLIREARQPWPGS